MIRLIGDDDLNPTVSGSQCGHSLSQSLTESNMNDEPNNQRRLTITFNASTDSLYQPSTIDQQEWHKNKQQGQIRLLPSKGLQLWFPSSSSTRSIVFSIRGESTLLMISGMLSSSSIKGQSADGNRMVKKYGIPMLITSDDNLKEYISTILAQVQGAPRFPPPPRSKSPPCRAR